MTMSHGCWQLFLIIPFLRIMLLDGPGSLVLMIYLVLFTLSSNSEASSKAAFSIVVRLLQYSSAIIINDNAFFTASEASCLLFNIIAKGLVSSSFHSFIISLTIGSIGTPLSLMVFASSTGYSLSTIAISSV